MAHDAISWDFFDARAASIHSVGDNRGTHVVTVRLSEDQQTASSQLAEQFQPGQLNFISDGQTHQGKDGVPIDADLRPQASFVHIASSVDSLSPNANIPTSDHLLARDNSESNGGVLSTSSVSASPNSDDLGQQSGGSTHTVSPAVAQTNNDHFIFTNVDGSEKPSMGHAFQAPDGGSQVVGAPGHHNPIDHLGDMHVGLGGGDTFVFDFGPQGNGITPGFHQGQDVVDLFASGSTQPLVHPIITAVTPDENALTLSHPETLTLNGSPLNALKDFIFTHH
jgi:hypothetical protein